jgi:hypothetical protein
MTDSMPWVSSSVPLWQKRNLLRLILSSRFAERRGPRVGVAFQIRVTCVGFHEGKPRISLYVALLLLFK